MAVHRKSGDIATVSCRTKTLFSAYGLALIIVSCFEIITLLCWLMFSAFSFNTSTVLMVLGPSLSGLVLAMAIVGLCVFFLSLIIGERGEIVA
jgi:hypothetical protein